MDSDPKRLMLPHRILQLDIDFEMRESVEEIENMRLR
jgi:hypothetical protein